MIHFILSLSIFADKVQVLSLKSQIKCNFSWKNMVNIWLSNSRLPELLGYQTEGLNLWLLGLSNNWKPTAAAWPQQKEMAMY